ncbi:uncharacterized protein METZ01_LOCUS258301, partial [marine metagenome]
GTTDYSYLWSTTDGSGLESDVADQSGLGAGTYKVVVTDANGCLKEDSFDIIEPDELLISLDTTTNKSLLCYGDSTSIITNITQESTPPYSFILNGKNYKNDTVIENIIHQHPHIDPYITTYTFTVVAGTYKVTVVDENGCSKTTDEVIITQPDAPLSLDSLVKDITCNGDDDGSIDITVSGGTKDYSYLWSTTNGSGLDSNAEDQSGLGPGTYKVVVTDANDCTIEDTFNITQPDVLSITDSLTNVSCNGGADGSIDITVSGGTKDYSYLWSKITDGSGLDSAAADQSGLGAGTYKVVVTDANGCKIEDTFIITQPDSALALSGSLTNISCNGAADGSIDITVSGGTKDYSY